MMPYYTHSYRRTDTFSAHTHSGYQPVPPVVMHVSVYVDRDQRWVLKHFRPLLSPQPQHWQCESREGSLTWHYLSRGACRSQCYTAHTDLQSPSLSAALCLTSTARLYHFFSACFCVFLLCPSAQPLGAWKSCMRVINQNDHISLAHRAVFIARSDDTMDFILCHALFGNTLSVAVSNFVRLALASPSALKTRRPFQELYPWGGWCRPTSVCDIQCNPTPHPHTNVTDSQYDKELTQCTFPRRFCS